MKKLKHVLSANDHLVTGRKFDILKNPETTILETHPRPTKEELPTYYDSENYTSHNDKSAGIVSFCYRIIKSISTSRKIRIGQNSLSKNTPQNKPRLLDVGCGTGDFLYSCLKKGWQINGIENNKNAKNNSRTEVFSFIYKAPFDNGLTEHEFDHVMIGKYEAPPNINKEEVEAYKWMQLADVKKDIEENPSIYTAWFKIIFEKSFKKLTNA